MGMSNIVLTLGIICLLAVSCSSTSIVGSAEAGPVSIALSLGLDGKVSVTGGIKSPKVQVAMGLIGLQLGIEQTYELTAKKPYYLFVLWEDSDGQIKRDEYEIGKKFEIKFNDNERVQQISGKNDSIIVAVTRNKVPTFSSSSIRPPAAPSSNQSSTSTFSSVPSQTSSASTSTTRSTIPSSISTEFYSLVNRHTQKCMTARGGNGNKLVQESCSSGRNDQLWRVPEGTTQVALESKSGVCVGWDPSNTSNTLYQVGCSGPRPWRLMEACSSYNTCSNPLSSPHSNPIISPVAFGKYYLIEYSGDCIDVDGWKHDDGAYMIHTECRYSNNDNQLWGRY